MVKEKRGGFHGIGVWKIPTGLVDAVCSLSKTDFIYSWKKFTIWLATWNLDYLQGEEIFEAAIREVKEETGVSIVSEYNVELPNAYCRMSALLCYSHDFYRGLFYFCSDWHRICGSTSIQVWIF